MDETDYLEQRVQDQIDWYDRKSGSCQRWFKRLRVIELVCAAAIPFISGISIPDHQIYVTLSVGFLGLLVTIAAGLLSLNQFQERWVEYRTTSEALKREKYLYLANSDPYTGDKRLTLLVHTVEGILAKEAGSWGQYMRTAAKKPPPDETQVPEEAPPDHETTVDVPEQSGDGVGDVAKAAASILTGSQTQTPSNPLMAVVNKALNSFSSVLGISAPPIGLVLALGTIAVKLSRDAYDKWKTRVLHLPYSPGNGTIAIVDANTGFALFKQSPLFNEAFAGALSDRKFLKEAAIDFVRKANTDSLWQKYRNRGQFASREDFEQGLQEFRKLALDAELQSVVVPEWLPPNGDYQQLMGDVDALQLDPNARGDLETLLQTVEQSQAKGEPVEEWLADIGRTYNR